MIIIFGFIVPENGMHQILILSNFFQRYSFAIIKDGDVSSVFNGDRYEGSVSSIALMVAVI